MKKEERVRATGGVFAVIDEAAAHGVKALHGA